MWINLDVPKFVSSCHLYVGQFVWYVVATVSRIHEIIGLFRRILFFYRALLQKRPMILSILLTKATPYVDLFIYTFVPWTLMVSNIQHEKMSFGMSWIENFSIRFNTIRRKLANCVDVSPVAAVNLQIDLHTSDGNWQIWELTNWSTYQIDLHNTPIFIICRCRGYAHLYIHTCTYMMMHSVGINKPVFAGLPPPRKLGIIFGLRVCSLKKNV